MATLSGISNLRPFYSCFVACAVLSCDVDYGYIGSFSYFVIVVGFDGFVSSKGY